MEDKLKKLHKQIEMLGVCSTGKVLLPLLDAGLDPFLLPAETLLLVLGPQWAWAHKYLSIDLAWNLTGSVFHDGKWPLFDLSGAILDGAQLTEMTLEGTQFCNTSLIRAKLYRSHANKADFGEAYLMQAMMTAVTLEDATFCRANLKEASLHEASGERVDFSHTNMVAARIQGCSFSKSTFYRADLRGALLYASTFEEADFGCAKLEGASLLGSSFEGARFHGATRLPTDEPIPGWQLNAEGTLERSKEVEDETRD